MPTPPTDRTAAETLAVLRIELAYRDAKLSATLAANGTPPDLVMCAVAMRTQIRDLVTLLNR